MVFTCPLLSWCKIPGPFGENNVEYYIELKDFDHFKYLGSVLTRDGRCTMEIKMRIAMAKEGFNIKISILTSKISIELGKKLVRCYVWSMTLYGSGTWTQRKLERK